MNTYTQLINQGIQQGLYQAKCQAAKILKQMQMSISQIAQATGLSEEEITNIEI